MNRRKLLNNSVIGLSTLGMWPSLGHSASFMSTPEKNDQYIGGGKYIDQSQSEQIRFVLASNKINGEGPDLYPVDFFPHGIAIDPIDPLRLVVFEKKGPGACEIDLRSTQSARSISPKKGHLFYGHGVFSSDGALVYATETDLTNQRGVITVRDRSSLSLVDEFPSFGENPHECVLFDDGTKMAITNAGGALGSGSAPCVTYVDVATGKLLETINIENPNLNAGHLALTNDLDLVVVSAPRDGLPNTGNGGVSIQKSGQPLRSKTTPENIVDNLKGESLSVAIHEPTKTAAVTNPDANLITFWNIEKQEFIESLTYDQPRGVALSDDEEHFVFSYGVETNLLWVSTRTLIPAEIPNLNPTYISGSHILNWSREVRRMAEYG